MKKEKHEEILKEVEEEIKSTLEDKRGLLFHQRRLVFMISLGAENLLELYFHSLDIMKGGSKLDHRWFKRKKEYIYERLQNQIVSDIKNIEKIEEIIDLIIKIEDKRDELVYGAPSSEGVLQEKINLYFKLREILK